MKAVFYDSFRGPIEIGELTDPEPPEHGVLIEVGASGVCRSDWHGWMGHDADIRAFPHVPGHELAGTIVEAGSAVTLWSPGDRVTTPFVCGCGDCPECDDGNQQICDHQTQPGFTHWGSFAELVAVHHADVNLVALPEDLDFVTAASLGCRFATSFRGIVHQGRVRGGEWVAVHGCGGVGLSAVMIAAARGARVIAIDIDDDALDLAVAAGAAATVNPAEGEDVVERIRQLSGRGAHLSIDALGSVVTAVNSVSCLRKRGRHVQIGLLEGDQRRPRLPMELVIANELEILGSHGMQAHCYPEMLALVAEGRLRPDRLIGKTLSLDDAPTELAAMDDFGCTGIAVIDRFG
jgi:alcohol dehydrogenase